MMNVSVTELRASMELSRKRAEDARYVIIMGHQPYEMVWGIYDDFRDDHYRQWNSIHDGYHIDLALAGIATLEEAIRECDEATARRMWGCGHEPRVVELPVKINPHASPIQGRLPGSFFDPELSKVYQTAPAPQRGE